MRTEAEIFQELKTAVTSQTGLPPNFRVLFLVGNTQMYVTQYSAMTAFGSSISDHLTKKRDRIIEVFTRIEFLVDELMRIHLIGINSPKDKEINDILDGMAIGRKLQFLKKWKLLSKDLQERLKDLIAVRNGVAHDVSLHNVFYKEKRIFAVIDNTFFNQFKEDLESTWNELLEVYRQIQNSQD